MNQWQAVLSRASRNKLQKQKLRLLYEQTTGIFFFLMDTLLLTCHFLFEQKQLSLQTPCSGGLWVLLAGGDLFTQPRDKVGLPAHPGATLTTTTSTTTTTSHLPLPLAPSDTQDLMVLLVKAGAPQYPPSEVRLEPPCSGSRPMPH